MLTEGSGREIQCAGSPSLKSSGGSRAALREGSKACVSWCLVPTTRVLAVLRSRTEGQDGPRVKDGEQLLGNRLTGDDGVGRDSGDGVADLAEQKLGEVVGAWAELGRS